jgi:phosphate transport system substrate-binding protein
LTISFGIYAKTILETIMLKKIAAALGALALLAACSNATPPKAGDTKPSVDIVGAGSSFFAPLGSKWAEGYKTETGASLNYQSIGSGGGIRQIKAKTVDFGATDKPLSAAELSEAGLYQFPVVMGGVVPVVNIPGIEAGKLNLTGQVLAEIFMGKIKVWNDKSILALNSGLTLPNLPITVVRRSDGSGTTFLFTNYLAKVSTEWKDKVGASDSLEWPVGIGGKGNEGVAAFVSQTVGAIGYVEFSYAKKTNAAYTNLQNFGGKMISPTVEAFSAAAAGADWKSAPGYQLLLLNQPGAQSWPISGAVFVLIYKDQADAQKAKSMLAFFDWAYAKGDASASGLYYIPMPETVKTMVRQDWAAEIKSAGQPVYVAKASN